MILLLISVQVYAAHWIMSRSKIMSRSAVSYGESSGVGDGEAVWMGLEPCV